MDNEATAEEVVAHLSDERLLHSYCTFNTLFRPLIAALLFSQLDDEVQSRRAIALEIASGWVASIEDIVIWVLVLRAWRPGKNLLFDLLDSTTVRENEGPQSTIALLQHLSDLTGSDLGREIGLPSDAELLGSGFERERIDAQRKALEGFLGLLRDALPIRTADEGVAVSSYNKIKHGVLAVCSDQNSRIGVSFLLASRRGPLDPTAGKRKINASWLPCEDGELAKMLFDTLVVSEALFILLNWLYTVRFDASWLQPSWPSNLTETLGQLRALGRS